MGKLINKNRVYKTSLEKREKGKKYRLEHKKELHDYDVNYKIKNKKKIYEKNADYRKKNKADIKIYDQKYYDENSQKIKNNVNQRYQENKKNSTKKEGTAGTVSKETIQHYIEEQTKCRDMSVESHE